MNVLSRRLGVIVAATAAVFCLAAVPAPAASAAPAAVAPAGAAAATVRAPWWCKPAHVGRNWLWEEGRRIGRWELGGHWDRREWNRRLHRWEWKHQWRETRYCAPVRTDGPPRRFDGPPATPRGPRS